MSQKSEKATTSDLSNVMEPSNSQSQAWFLSQLFPESRSHEDTIGFQVSGSLDFVALRQAVHKAINRHSVLQMCVDTQSGRLRPAGSSRMAEAFQVVHADSPDDLVRLVEKSTDKAFDLTAGPLARCRVFTAGPSDHVVMVSMHRLVGDRASLRIFLRDVAAYYTGMVEADTAGQTAPARPLSYAHWSAQKAERSGGVLLTEHATAWASAFRGVPPALDLPTDHVRPVHPQDGTGTSARELPTALVEGVRQAAQKAEVPTLEVLLAAYAVLLHRFSGQDDLVIGLTTDGRTPATADVVGPFSTVVPVRVQMDDNPRFGDLLGRIHDAVLACRTYEHVPFDVLVKHLNPQRHPGRHPVFQAVLRIEDQLDAPFDLVHSRATPIPLVSRTAPGIDLELCVNDSPGGTAVRLSFPTDVFASATGDTLLSCYTSILTAASTPDLPVSSIALLDPRRLNNLLSRWTRDQQLDEIARPTLHSLVERQCRRTPDNIAIAWRGETITYRELDARANRLAHEFHQRGMGLGNVVAVCLARTPSMVAALLGVMKAGAAFVGLDPDHPDERLEYLLADSGATLLVTESRLGIGIGGYTGAVVDLDQAADSLAQRPDTSPPCSSQGEDLAYIAYTSGSTGRPKGAAVEHRSVVNLVEGRAKVYGPKQFEASLASSSIAFDATVSELFVALTTGGTVVLIDSLLDLIDAPPTVPVRMLETVPSVLRELLRHGALPASVRTVCLSGERLSADLVDEIYDTTAVKRVYNTYGPTEATVSALHSLVPRGCPRPPIGRPQPGVRAYVLDGELNPVPPGMRGGLFLGGVGVARGYLGKSELTRERFLPDPFVGIQDARMYRTGDVVRETVDGQVEWLGREDRQVKLRGQRLELGEIEHVLLRQPEVRDAAVISHRQGGDHQLLAYVVANRAVEPTALQAAMHRELPHYMVPAEFMQLERMPLNGSGKLDVMALPLPSVPLPGPQEPESAVEVTLIRLWRELLGRDDIGVNDDFFDRSGHSLLALRLARSIGVTLRREVTVHDIFEARTVRLLAAAVASARSVP